MDTRYSTGGSIACNRLIQYSQNHSDCSDHGYEPRGNPDCYRDWNVIL